MLIAIFGTENVSFPMFPSETGLAEDAPNDVEIARIKVLYAPRVVAWA